MNTTFVTGGSGFVGRALIRALRARGDEVRALARTPAAAKRVAELGANPVLGDLDTLATRYDDLCGCDLVVHAAGHYAEWGTLDQFERGNVIGTRNALAAARNASVPRFVHVSTAAVLADGSPLRRIDETYPRPARPFAGYSASKAAAEAMALAANDARMQTIVVRPQLVWGAGDTSSLRVVMAAVRRGGFAWISGGRYLTSPCHVDNVVEGILCAADAGRGGEIYFLTDGEPVEFRAFMTRMLATQGVYIGNRVVPLAVARTVAWGGEALWRGLRLPGHPPATRMGICMMGREVTISDAKARRELGYVGSKSVEEGMRELLATSPGGATHG